MQNYFRNGKIISYEYPELGFVSYYPQEDILVLEGGHSSEIIFNLSTGADREEVGDPEYICYSPSEQHRLSTYYSGQSSIYFIQERVGDRYKTVVDMSGLNSAIERLTSFGIDYFPDAFWQSDTVLNFVIPYYYDGGRKEKKLYFQLTLK